MLQKLDRALSKALDRMSDYIANHRGVPILICLPMVVFNYVLRAIPGTQLGFVETTDLFLHLAVFVGLLGILLGEAL